MPKTQVETTEVKEEVKDSNANDLKETEVKTEEQSKPEEKSLEQLTNEEDDKRFLAKTISDTRNELSEIKEQLNSLLTGMGQNGFSSGASSSTPQNKDENFEKKQQNISKISDLFKVSN